MAVALWRTTLAVLGCIFAALWFIDLFLMPTRCYPHIPTINYARLHGQELRVHLRDWNRQGNWRTETIELYSGLTTLRGGQTAAQRAAWLVQPGVKRIAAEKGKRGWFHFALADGDMQARSYYLIPVNENGYSVTFLDTSDVIRHGATFREVRFDWDSLFCCLALGCFLGMKFIDARRPALSARPS
jgi:hypothetical protein